MGNAIQPRNQATKRTINTTKNHEKNMGISRSSSSGSNRRRDEFVTPGAILLGRRGAAACCRTSATQLGHADKWMLNIVAEQKRQSVGINPPHERPDVERRSLGGN